MALDERLRRAIERAGEPADPSGVYEDLIRRRERRRIGAGVAKRSCWRSSSSPGRSSGVLALSRLFGGPGEDASRRSCDRVTDRVR